MKRIVGFDAARAVAIAGMVVVNFKVVMFAGERGPDWLQSVVGAVDGRAAAMFVILAGVGASLMTADARTRGDPAGLAAARRRLLRRAAFLL
ncbi:MAG: heparan-alpha-glucosaminide N-acetyltransferase domain-containing protein, partial [Acidimicrobiia bacterium]|nr:heparan-alpha-glucosaminide N-acetyltransferase domain-containing protein [Acidimicrobiia bacterium]